MTKLGIGSEQPPRHFDVRKIILLIMIYDNFFDLNYHIIKAFHKIFSKKLFFK